MSSPLKPYFQDTKHNLTLYHGSSYEIIPQLTEKFSLILTDPPWGIGFKSNHVIRPLERTRKIVGDESDDLSEFFRLAYSVCDEWLLCFTRWDKWSLHERQAKAAGWGIKNMLVWDKTNWTSGDLKGNLGYQHELIIMAAKGDPKIVKSRHGNIFRVPRIASEINSCEKPVSLMSSLAMIGTGLILDPFVGSGATLEAAKSVGRGCVAVEIEERQCEYVAKRLSRSQEGLF